MTETAETHDQPAHTPSLRAIADALCLWGLCARPACRRARFCRHEPRDCLSRYAPLVPEAAREGLGAMIEGKSLGWSFEDLMADAREEVLALVDWSNRVAASNFRLTKMQHQK